MIMENSWPGVYKDLVIAKNLLYDKLDLACTNPQAEPESAEYAAYNFSINKVRIKYRAAKITPTKTGQFVTLWKRNANGPIEPLAFTDDFDVVVISTRAGNNFGQFIFPKAVLAAKGIITANGKEGKRGFRVYPPWNMANSSQANKTQLWQSEYFLNLAVSYDPNRAKNLYNIN
ncbi:MAG: hypothetical protein EOP47_18275 [Sphingobacteriaceae bacterium]|nr:MAG: hypothetical protein EOP47_18275 [Sphingobacteriaceae bacterium]